MTLSDEAEQSLKKVMRASYGKLLAALCARTNDVASCEDALAHAFSSALESWKTSGLPKNLEGWIFQVAKNKLIDIKRKERRHSANSATLLQIHRENAEEEESGFKDERLKLLFVCSHPSIDESMRTPLMLQTVLGLDSAAIASAFLSSPAAMMKRLVRVKQKIKLAGIHFEIPDPERLLERTEHVVEAIFAAYGNSWDAMGSSDQGASDLNDEALYLSRLLVELLPDQAEPKALLALILFCKSRKAARRSPDQTYIPLNEQDIGAWNHAMIAEADRLLEAAFKIGTLGRFQLEAAIQSAHSARLRWKLNNWTSILQLYNGLLTLAPSIGAMLGRASALCEVAGPDKALESLAAIDKDLVQSHQPYWALRADLLAKLGRAEEADEAYETAIGLSQDESVRNFLRQRKKHVR